MSPCDGSSDATIGHDKQYRNSSNSNRVIVPLTRRPRECITEQISCLPVSLYRLKQIRIEVTTTRVCQVKQFQISCQQRVISSTESEYWSQITDNTVMIKDCYPPKK